MNKEELQRKLDEATKRRMEISDNICWLKDQLAEAEKPKLRHGDFGINYTGHSRITLFRNGNDGGKRDDYCPYGMVSDSKITVFGNIFDLLKEWSEPMEPRQQVACIDIKIKGTKLFIGDYLFASLESKEKLWHILGHAIAELKRKENKCS